MVALEHVGEILGKDGEAMFEKFTSGLPTFFNVDASTMAKDNADPNILYPANYGMDPEFALAPNALVAHPHAGSVDLHKMCRKYLNQWAKKIATLNRNAPSGMIKSAELVVDSEHFLNLLAKDVNNKTRCETCGGLGHASSQILDDGSLYLCASKRLRNRPLASSANSAVSDVESEPDTPFDMDELAEVINSLQESSDAAKAEIHELQKALAASQGRKPFPRRRMSPKTTQNTQNTFSLTDDTYGMDGDNDEQFMDDDDNASDASAHSTMSASHTIFANAAIPGKKFTFNRRSAKKQ